MQKEKLARWTYFLIFLLLILLCGYMLMKLYPIYRPVVLALKNVLIPFLLAALITYLLHPVVEALHKKGLPRFIAILIIYLLFFGGTGWALVAGIPHVIQQLKSLMSNIPEIARLYKSVLIEVDHHTSRLPYAMHTKIDGAISNMEIKAQSALAGAILAVRTLLDYFFVFLVTPFLVFYFLNDFEKMRRGLWYITPKRWRREGGSLLHDIDVSLGGYIRGQVLVGAILGAAAATALWIIDMPYPILLGLFIAVTDVIPYFGPIIGAIPVLFLAFTVSWKMVWIAAAIMLLLQFIEGNILGPLIVGRNVHIHPAFIIFALLLGGELGGIIGMIAAVPVLAVAKVVILHIRDFRSHHQTVDKLK
ncbi:AI-2E family transporter [Fictibacillus iocasae]|uniref:AI-2E family transporter n=1 Tax=Fictibacillus iocasae TaxID=2715437 RepID=A0ABW2NXK1_9BACL